MTSEELAWHNAAQNYSNVVLMGGTREQRTWAWQRAAAALDTYVQRRSEDAKARARQDTVEIEAA